MEMTRCGAYAEPKAVLECGTTLEKKEVFASYASILPESHIYEELKF